ncbi:MAG: LysE family transporter [Verrucomicrobiae bacterium]|nr:LysE family transporter [Verrucomicrobiae bacterium]
MEQYPILLAGLTGYVIAAMFSSIPVGPINLTILNEGAQRGFRWAMLIGLGASTMEVIYCALSFTGFSTLFNDHLVKAAMQLFSFLFLLFIGYKFLTAQTVHVPTKLDSASRKFEAKLGKKLHPRSAFTTGFVRVMGNLGVLLTWIVLAANFMAHDWVADTFAAKSACVAGVALGTNTWFFIFSYSISRGHGKFSEATLLRFQHLSGISLIAVGLFDGAHIIWQLARHKI